MTHRDQAPIDGKHGGLKSAWAAYAIVFIASGCTLILEIVAGRILAPYIGVSIYTWTSIIGVVLAGISLGNYVGGLLADRWASRGTLAVVLGLGGLSSLAILPLIEVSTTYDYPSGFPLVAKIVAMTTAIFFPPSFILGMVSPIVVKLTLRDLSRTGGIVGRIYAFSTLGSILGTFLTGFVLIAYLGTRMIVLAVGIVLLVLTILASGLLSRRPRPAEIVAAVLGALALAGVLYATAHMKALDSGCLRETHYYCIKVVPLEVDENRTVQQLVLDHLIHSFNDLNDPTYLHYGYMRVYAEVMDYVAQSGPDFRVLHIGGGGYTLPRYIEQVYPRASDVVMEIDPGVTETAYERLGLAPTTKVRTINGDARLVVEDLRHAGEKFDIVFGDAFNDLSVPYHLTTREFDLRLKELMNPQGIYLINVIDKVEGGRFLASMVRTLQTVFSYVYVLNDWEAWYTTRASTYVVAASDAPLDFQRLATVRGQGASGFPVTRAMPQDRMQEWLASADALLLTDDHAPVDNLLAPLFVERGS